MIMRNEKIKASFPQKTESFHHAVQNALLRLPEKEENMNRKAFLKRGLVLSFAAALAIGVTVYAASGVITQITSSSRSEAEYKTLPAEQQLIEDVGYAPELPEAFENGYTFDEASLVHNDQQDEAGNSVDKFDSITARYARGDGEMLLSAAKPGVPFENEGAPTENYQGIDLYYNAHTYKFVPPDYELTEEDKAAQERGDTVFSYGTDTVEVRWIQSVSFDKDDIHYNLSVTDDTLSQQDILAMAKEIIDR